MKPQKPTPKNVAERQGWILIAPSENQDGKPDGGWYINRLTIYPTKVSANVFRFRHERAIRGKIVML